MYSEFLVVLAWRRRLGHGANILHRNETLDRLLVDVVQAVVRDGECSLLCPLEHVRLLNLAGKYECI